ncbi:MAG: hemolysin family protein [Candidatus Binatales bacterium]
MTAIGVAAAVAACVLVQAFFAAGEIALVMADELKLRAGSERGEADSRLLSGLLARRDRLLALVLTSTNLANAIAAAVLTSFLYAISPHVGLLAPLILVPLTLVLGESAPKLLTLKRPLAFARVAARPLKLLATALAPLLAIETALSRSVRRLAGVPAEVQSVFMTRDDLALLVHRQGGDAHAGRDAILPAEQQMISRIFRFSRSEARKAMVPLIRVEAVSDDTTLARAIEVVRREGFTRLPVFSGRIVNIVGVVHVFDLLEAPDLNRPVSEVTRPVSYFPEATPLDEILLALQRTGESMAVVVDEYGGAAGIITVEDLLEEVVGEIDDEYDSREELARLVDLKTLAVSARAAVVELNERFGLRLPEGDEYATIGGLVVERLGHIPKPGEQLKVGDLTISVARSDARAVRELVLQLAQPLRSESARRR